jgi:hypothetical protein
MSKALDRSQRAGSDPIQIGSTKLVTDSNNDLTVQDTSNNTKKLIASEVHIGTGSDKVILKRSSSDGKLQLQTTDGSSTTDSEVSSDSSSGSGTTVYANIAAMVAVSSPAAGSQALVTANKGLYIYNGSGWYKIATVNTSPSLVSPATGTDIVMATDGAAASIELVATDADEGTVLQNSYTVSTGSLTNGGGTTATVTSSATSNGTYSALAAGASTTNRFFKVTPTTNTDHQGSFSLQFSISDGTNAATTVQNFALAFAVSGSLYFDGTGDYLSIADSDDWHFGTGDFTLEAWVYSNSFANGYNGIIAQWPQNGGNANNSFVLETVGTELDFYTVHGGTTLTSHTGSITLDLYKWYHVAVQRSSGTIKSYVNGIEDFSVSNNNNFNNPSSPVTVGGGVVGTGGSWNGYISNARIVKGTAVYTPTTPNVGSSAVATTGLLSTPTSLPNWGTTWTLETWVYMTNNGSYNVFFEGKPNGNNFGYLARRSSGTLDVYYVGGFADTPGSGTINLNQWHHIALSNNSGSIKVFIDGVQTASGTANTAIFPNGSGQLHMMSQGDTVWQTKGYMSDTRLVIGTSVYSGAFTPPSDKLTKTGGTYPSTTNVNTSFPAAHTYLLTNQTTSGSTISDNSDQNYTMVTGGSLAGSTTKPYSNFITTPTKPLTAITNTKLLVGSNSDATTVTNGSYLFNASSENLLVSHSDMSFGTGDWTIDFWFKLLANTGSNQWLLFFGPSNASDNTESIHVYFPSNRQLTFWDFSGGGFYGLLGVPTNNVWYHVRYVRHGLNHYQFLDGNCYEAYASGNSSARGNIITTGQSFVAGNSYDHNPSSNDALRIGGGYSGGYGLSNGLLLSNLRVVKGTALNTSAAGFARPTAPLTAVSGTVLLTAQNGTGNPTVDNSGTNKTISVAQGSPTTDTRNIELATSDESASSLSITENGNTAFSYVSPFDNPSGGSTKFDGTGDYVETPSHASLQFGTGNFTVEFWVYTGSLAATIMPFDTNYSGGGIGIYIGGGGDVNHGKLFVWATGGNTLINDGTGTAPLMQENTWYHVALVRNGGQLRCYQNGVMITSSSGAASNDGSHASTTNYTQQKVTIGVKQTNHSTFAHNGYISNFRVVVGSAVYTSGDSSFTAPTSALTAITNTQLLTCQNSTGAITDASSNNYTLVIGNDAIATKFVPF